MTIGEADKARRRARDAAPEDVRKRVNEALGHLDERTFAERLQVLSELARTAVPGATGQTAKWERRIVAVRNGFAHQLTDRERIEDEGREYLVLLRSLRWMLTGVLLIETGLDLDLPWT